MTTRHPWADPGDVLEHVAGVGGVVLVDEAKVTPYLDAAAAFVERRRPDLFDVDEPPATGEDVPSDVLLGVALLVARLWARRGTSLGIQGYEAGVATVVANDPDVAALLGLGVHGVPGLGG